MNKQPIVALQTSTEIVGYVNFCDRFLQHNDLLLMHETIEDKKIVMNQNSEEVQFLLWRPTFFREELASDQQPVLIEESISKQQHSDSTARLIKCSVLLYLKRFSLIEISV